MRATSLLGAIAGAASVAQGARILQTNDDGWAELYLRSLNSALNAAGHDVVLSAPAENQSGTGSSDKEPPVRTTACQYNSCNPATNPADRAPIGRNASNTRLNWVNAYPVTSVRYGLDSIARPNFWNGALPDLVVSGPNVGGNTWLAVQGSGTVGAAVYAAGTRNLPSVAFSGASTGTLAWNTVPVPARSTVYAQLSATLVAKLLSSDSGPVLPQGVWLNVNFPQVTTQCSSAASFKWVLSRINPGLLSASDVTTCGSDRLPTESSVVGTSGCYIAVSVGDAADKSTADKDRQAVVLQKLTGLLTCLP